MKFLSIENIYILEVCDCEVCYIQVKKSIAHWYRFDWTSPTREILILPNWQRINPNNKNIFCTLLVNLLQQQRFNILIDIEKYLLARLNKCCTNILQQKQEKTLIFDDATEAMVNGEWWSTQETNQHTHSFVHWFVDRWWCWKCWAVWLFFWVTKFFK